MKVETFIVERAFTFALVEVLAWLLATMTYTFMNGN